MNAKNKLIEKLLRIAKRHKILTYPVLALVAVISVINYFFSWSAGAGRRVVAVVMVLVMLVSQSYFLTSSANALVDDQAEIDTQVMAQENAQLTEGETVENPADPVEEDAQEEPEAGVADNAEESNEEPEVPEENTEDLTPVTDQDVDVAEEGGSESLTDGVEDSTSENGEDGDNTSEDEKDGSTEDNKEDEEKEKIRCEFFFYNENGESGYLGAYDVVKNDDSTCDLSDVVVNLLEGNSNKCYDYVGPWKYFNGKTSSGNVDLSKATPNVKLYGKDAIQVCCTRKLVNYKVNVDLGGGECTYSIGAAAGGSNTAGGNQKDDFTVYVPLGGTLRLDGLKRYGYEFDINDAKNSVSVSASIYDSLGGGVDSSDENGYWCSVKFKEIPVTNSPTECTVSINWKGLPYTIVYAKNAEDINSAEKQEVRYGDRDEFFSLGAFVEEKQGLDFAGWTLDPDKTIGAKPEFPLGARILGYQEILLENAEEGKVVTLYPFYKYKDIFLLDDSITYHYQQPLSGTDYIQCSYDGKTPATNLEYIITSGTNWLEDLGIEAVATDKGILLKKADSNKTEGPRKVAKGGIKLGFTVKDKAVSSEVEPFPFEFTVCVEPMDLEIQNPSEEAMTKIYDGNTTVSKNFPESGKLVAKSKYGNVEAKVEYDNASYNSPDVKDASYIELNNARIDFDDTELNGDHDCYRLVDSSPRLTGAKITPRNVFVVAKAEPEKILAGQEHTLVYSVEEDKNNSYTETGLIGDDAGKNVNEVIEREDINYGLQRKSGSGNEIVYYVTAKINNEKGLNYRLAQEMDGNSGTVTIVTETPTGSHENNPYNYVINGYNAATGWIQSPATISVSAPYRVAMLDGSVAAGKLPESEGTGGKTYSLQLRENANTSVPGAYTSEKNVTLKVDTVTPKFLGFSVESQGHEFANTMTDDSSDIDTDSLLKIPYGTQLFVPDVGGPVSFGNYYSQTVTVKLKFKDTASGVKEIHFLDRVIPVSGVTDADGSVIVGIDVSGTLDKFSFSACDVAGNETTQYTLTKNGNGDDEWIVENVRPQINAFSITSTKSEGTDFYLNNCGFSLDVTDSDSGIRDVRWMINGKEYDAVLAESMDVRDDKQDVKQKSYIFTTSIDATAIEAAEIDGKQGCYQVSAKVYDNAGNVVATGDDENIPAFITCQVDPLKPEIKVINEDEVEDGWHNTVRIQFITWDTLSGVEYIEVLDKNGRAIELNKKEETIIDGYKTRECSFEIDHVDNYTIKVRDYAGNVATRNIHLGQVSNEKPVCPDISLSPAAPDGNNGWYVTRPIISILPSLNSDNKMMTEIDKIPVATSYTMTRNLHEDLTPKVIEDTVERINIANDGEYSLDVKAVSKTNVSCLDSHVRTFKVDTEEPTIELTTEKGNGSSVIMKFTVSDTASGADGETVKVTHDGETVVVKGDTNNGVYTGSFEIEETGNYIIEASDMAGNKVVAPAFSPMSMKVKAVTNITKNTATLGAMVIKGSADIQSASLAYRRYSDDTYQTVKDEVIKIDPDTGNVAVSTVLSGLQKATSYVFKVTAVSSLGEVLEYEGYFKTLNDDGKGIDISGVARYADGNTEKTITVGLFGGNECINATEVTAGDRFTLSNVPDGNYSIVATDGKYSKTLRVLIEDGMVIYPNDSIVLVLSGENTSVVITTEDTPNITADNMDSIFERDIVNYPSEEKELVSTAGVMVEFKLYATLMTVSAVSPEEISAMYAATDSNKIVGAYLDLSLYKVVTDEYGLTKRSRVTELGNGANVSVTIPLGELAGKPGLEVIRIHYTGERFLGKYLHDEDSNPDTYTISTDQFSTYAVLYDASSGITEKPSTEKPSTEKPSTEKPVTEKPSTERPVIQKPSTEKPITQKPTTEDDGIEPGIDRPIEPDTSTRAGGTARSSVGTLRSSGSAKTGDASPVTAMAGVIMISFAGFFVLRKKIKQL